MMPSRSLCGWFLCWLIVVPLWGDEPSPAAIRLGKRVVSRWQFGLEVTAAGGPVTGIVATLPVPMDWPEQQVRTLHEAISRQAKVTYRVVDDAVKQMVVTIPSLAASDTATVLVEYEIDKAWIEGPTDTQQLRIPKGARGLSKFLGASPFIETTDPALRAQGAQFASADQPAWNQTRHMFDWVREHVQYRFAEEIRPAPAALRDGVGDCEELSSLFIAFCRLQKIPARAVWVPGHTYPEFALQDSAGTLHWFPCQAAGETADFGRMPEDRPILQKGDNLRLPGEKQPQRYAKQTLAARHAVGTPQVKFIMRPVVAEKESD
jgi:hypothetical protein